MDERISSAAYNPFNDYDISTARGNQRFTEEAEARAAANANPANFPAQLRLFIMQLGILAVMAIGFTVFS